MNKDKKSLKDTKIGKRVVRQAELAYARGLGYVAATIVNERINQVLKEKNLK
ncbi:hypothetical protein [Bacillus thuringiensis]|uniref:hypothetical protein n=1 Tax=Bacillus thuringiensis TaxID=1428 RepID=UPI003827E62D